MPSPFPIPYLSPSSQPRDDCVLVIDDAKKMKYKAIIFDLYGTLIEDLSYDEYQQVLAQMAEVLSVPYQDFASQWSDASHLRTTGGYETVEDSIRENCKGMSWNRDRLQDAVHLRMEYMRNALTPREDALETLTRLKDLGYKIGLISDCGLEVPLLWPDTPFAPIVLDPVFSSTAGTKKPDPAIYQMACDRLGVEPQDCLYIGDGNSQELSGASKMGMEAILISVPDAVHFSYGSSEAKDWKGRTISALKEVLDNLDA